ncbi:hypothetical protein OG625_33425 [Streptomyces sp. NBC_01351]|uniref:hypothetical protein n=1 Tax=Streptomyces sp. NBC_01351 TaxID=2903833 RepID=UPI002E309644|nr:hypothetical protein [Streptomyces sp. NBC_01351]
MQEKARHQAKQDEWADRVVARTGFQEELDRALRDALRRPPSQREETITRMADALRGAAQGLTVPGCAAAAGVSERTLREWLVLDAGFAGALRAARALAEAHGANPGPTPTPAALQLMLNAIRKGATLPAAANLIGLSVRGFNRLRADAPSVAALVAAARRARSAQATPGRWRRPPGSAGLRAGYRIVELDDPVLSPGSRRDDPEGGSGEGITHRG